MNPQSNIARRSISYYTMCMHIQQRNELDCLIATVERLDTEELGRLQEAIDRRRSALKQSPVLERRDYRHGVLQLEGRAYRRKDGEQTVRGPYWYFHYREGSRQRTTYLGKTDDPETIVDEKLGREE
jgi:hypothetical protein